MGKLRDFYPMQIIYCHRFYLMKLPNAAKYWQFCYGLRSKWTTVHGSPLCRRRPPTKTLYQREPFSFRGIFIIVTKLLLLFIVCVGGGCCRTWRKHQCRIPPTYFPIFIVISLDFWSIYEACEQFSSLWFDNIHVLHVLEWFIYNTTSSICTYIHTIYTYESHSYELEHIHRFMLLYIIIIIIHLLACVLYTTIAVQEISINTHFLHIAYVCVVVVEWLKNSINTPNTMTVCVVCGWKCEWIYFDCGLLYVRQKKRKRKTMEMDGSQI